MEKQFQEVFPDLRIEGGMAELLDTVEVSRVSINKKKDLLRIYVVSHQCRASIRRKTFWRCTVRVSCSS